MAFGIAPGRIVARPATAGDRNGATDLARGLGALGIVWFHAHLPLQSLALTALPMFTVLTIYFGAGRPLAARARRLLMPWLGWSLAYGLLKLADGLSSGQGIGHEFAPWMLLTGPALHLWFLPFAVAALALLALARGPLGVALLLASAVAAGGLFHAVPLGMPFAQWASVWPAAVLGGLMARTTRPAHLAALASVGFALLLTLAPGTHLLVLSLGLAAAALALAIHLPAAAWTDWISRRALDLYLAHPLFIALVTRATGDDIGLAGFALVVAGSIALAELMDRIRAAHAAPARPGAVR